MELSKLRKELENERNKRHDISKRAVHMLKLNGMTIEEIAKGLNIPESTARYLASLSGV